MKIVRLARGTLAMAGVIVGAVVLTFGAAPARAALMPPQANLKLQLAADLGVTYDGGTGKVNSWLDQTANAFNVAQADATYQPVRVANQLNSRPVLRFDGANDYLNNTVSNVFAGGDARTVFVVAQALG